ncbi:SpoIIE family protein phosphatase [Mycobacterium paraterrae]|uniref:SpoIIE family protein phosphatase n=1 Tax=Mycobacterium paraterrae TaxID=577492 RepID=A0ABY3VM00_9MYCO|nr:SpoIIE family protein phosphatase [Mycobacterium paraterrae]UMB68538.1 SpoIIE family protein phosphatase [Mycobacterium paraterrae]
MGHGGDLDDTIGEAQLVRRAFDSLPSFIVAFDGPDHRYVAANAATRQAFPAVRLGVPARELFPEFEDQNLIDILTRVYRTGEIQQGREWRFQFDFDGSGTMQEVCGDIVVSPRVGVDGAIEGTQVMLTDATARVQERRAAEDREAELSERYTHVRDLGILVQRALLSPSLPVLPGADIAAEYLVATEDTGAGGDWFDAVVGDSGSVFLVVGDVVGHGVDAAAVMAQLRTAIRVHLLAGSGIAESLTAVDEFSRHVPGSKAATVCIARLDPSTGSFEYCTAGHPPPLLIAGGRPRFLQPSGAGPLGSGIGFRTAAETIAVGDAILIYSDGIIERPGRPLAASTAEFADIAARILGGSAFPIEAPTRPVERLCSQTLELMLRTTGYNDDVTLLAVQRRTPPPALELSVDATVHAARDVREPLRAWLAEIGADDVDVLVIVQILCEFVENSYEHGYRSSTVDRIEVQARLDERGEVHASVTDHGQWKAPSSDPGMRGRGLMLANALATASRVAGTDRGTVASITHRLSRPARIVTDPNVLPAAAPSAAPEFFTEVVEGRLVVHGDVDNATAPILATHIARQSRSGTHSLTVELSAVTHLGSTGLRILAEAQERSRQHGTDLGLIAPPGCPAHHVLALVGLPLAGEIVASPVD